MKIFSKKIKKSAEKEKNSLARRETLKKVGGLLIQNLLIIQHFLRFLDEFPRTVDESRHKGVRLSA